jgi:Leucine-rich repeat (LRR) protein
MTIGSLSHLVILSLDGNQLTGTIPSTFGFLSNIENLYLRENKLIGTIPTEIYSLAQLRYFYLHTNSLHRINIINYWFIDPSDLS